MSAINDVLETLKVTKVSMDDRSTLNKLIKFYGRDNVQIAAEEYISNTTGSTTLYGFLNKAPGLLSGDNAVITAEALPVLENFLKQSMLISSGTVSFSDKQKKRLSSYLTTCGLDDMIAAFKHFYGQLSTEGDKAYAAKNFTEKAQQFVDLIGIQRERRKETERMIEAATLKAKEEREVLREKVQKELDDERGRIEEEL